MIFFKNFINGLKKLFLTFKNFFYLFNNSFETVFFSESKFYQKYFYSFIKIISENNKKIIYLHSQLDDQINLPNVRNIYIGEGFFLKLCFRIIKANNFFMTLIDLGNHSLKKSKYVKKYIYIFHGVNSTHKTYTENAFDNYDVIFCPGKVHKNEIITAENLRNIKKKKIIEIGYFYFDYLISKSKIKENKTILIATSWNYSKQNFTNNNLIELLNNCLKLNEYNFIFLPHPEQLKRDSETISRIEKQFEKNKNFKINKSFDNSSLLEKSILLITDNSGIAIEYMLIYKRPTIYFNKFSKIHNKNFSQISNYTLEDEIKEKFGYLVKNPNFKNITIYINEAVKEMKRKEHLINDFVSDNFYNFGTASLAAYNCIYVENLEKKKN